ncbi:MAG TPA: hypothetical protein VGG74_21040 [Kofleriaceae bacterium]|jgi:hypothetical protein
MAELHIGPITFLGESNGVHVHARVLGAGVAGSRPMCGTIVLRQDEWDAVERLTDRYAELDRRVADLQRANELITAAAKSALVRMLWASVCDHAQCTCSPNDACPECEAMGALGLGRWTNHELAQQQLEQLSGPHRG